MPDLFYELPYRCGVFVPVALTWSQIVEDKATEDPSGKKIEAIYARPWVTLLDHLPVSDLDSVVMNRKLGYFQKWIAHESKDAYWTQGATLEKLAQVKIPVLIQSGWFDAQLLGSKLAYNTLISSGNKHVKMVIGPWGHVDKESKFHEGLFMGEAADDIDLHTLYREWFDHWLKGEENGIMASPRVQLYALHANTWLSGSEYPLPSTLLQNFYLQSSGGSRLPVGGSLSLQAPLLSEHQDSLLAAGVYTYNPAHVVAFGKEQGRDIAGFLSQLTGRSDYLFYQSAPFTDSTMLLGPISATIYASSSAADTDWFVLLFSIPSDGRGVQPVSFGLLRAKFRNGFAVPQLMRPGEIYRFDIDLNQYGTTLSKGERLGVVITSSFCFPYFSKNLNTGLNSQTTTQTRIAQQKIYSSAAYPSHITVPLIIPEE
ncbi:MAG: CocE/NonD family hydrolase, partial [Bacteroidales bacterium]